jgi:tellurite methyltransferase
MTIDRWDARYRSGETGGSDPSDLVMRAAAIAGQGDALDIACGTGRNAIWLASQGWRVAAVDGSAEAIRILLQRAAGGNATVDARVVDLERELLPFPPASFDMICNVFYLQRSLFPVIRQLLRPAGLFVAAIHMIDDSPGARPMNPDFLLQPGELESAFGDWEIIESSHGRSHERATVKLIARKRQ